VPRHRSVEFRPAARQDPQRDVSEDVRIVVPLGGHFGPTQPSFAAWRRRPLVVSEGRQRVFAKSVPGVAFESQGLTKSLERLTFARPFGAAARRVTFRHELHLLARGQRRVKSAAVPRQNRPVGFCREAVPSSDSGMEAGDCLFWIAVGLTVKTNPAYPWSGRHFNPLAERAVYVGRSLRERIASAVCAALPRCSPGPRAIAGPSPTPATTTAAIQRPRWEL
jgi:hypothetical protein